MSGALTDELRRFPGITLEDLDRRAALLKRIDNKYAVPWELFLELIERLRGNHAVLEIDGRREFDYDTTYFETPDRRCFVDHVEGRCPRFKARTRCYLDTGFCVFEVKLKDCDGNTDKHQIDYSVDDRRRMTDAAKSCLVQTLRAADVEPPDELEPGIHTTFRRVTLAADGRSERLTCDLDVRLSSRDGPSAAIRDRLVLVETKTEGGDSPADAALAEMGLVPISLSKYRVGMGLLGGAETDRDQPGSELFERRQVSTR